MEINKEEIWKDVVGFEGYYEVSNKGRVRSVDRVIMRSNGFPLPVKGKIMPQYKKWGHSTIPRLYVNFCKDSIRYVRSVSRLVGEAFIPNQENLPQINHKDENPMNNCVENLEWCSNEYNHNYGTRNLRQSLKLRKSIDVFDLNGNFLSHHDSIKEAARIYNCDESSITKVCKNKYRYTNKLVFRYSF